MKEKQPFRGVKVFFIGYFAVLVWLLTIIGIMERYGLLLVDAGMKYLFFGVLVVSAMIALTVIIAKRIQRRWLKILSTAISAGITIAAALAMLVLFAFALELSVPAHFNSFTSPGGKTAVVMRTYSKNEELRELRPIIYDDGTDKTGIIYKAYPRVAGIFYNSKHPGEGELEIGLRSPAQLMIEWTDENTLHLFIENAQTGDAGEYWLKLE